MMDDVQRAQIEALVEAPTLYPDEPRKAPEVRRAELEHWFETYGEVNERYNQFGLDIEGSDGDAYLDSGRFRKQRFDANSSYHPEGSSFSYNYTLATRDKYLFETFAALVLGQESGKYCRSLGALVDGSFQELGASGFSDLSQVAREREGRTLVFKSAFGCSGAGVQPVDVRDGLFVVDDCAYSPEELAKYYGTRASMWLVQDKIEQHPDMAAFNASSVNTLRIVTFNVGDRVEVAPVVMRFGKPGTFADNPASGGGFVCGIGFDGRVLDDAIDPVDKVRIANPRAGARIPFFEDALALAKRLHGMMPGLFTVGWDVCITPEGPLVIEGNDGWEPFLTQTPRGNALRQTWDALIAEREEYYGGKR